MSDVRTEPIHKVCQRCGEEFEGVLIHSVFGTLDPSGTCDPCLDELKGEEDALRSAQRAADALKRSELPQTLETASIASVGPSEARSGAERWIEEGGGLCLTGPVGVGKSYLAAASVRARCETKGVATRWVSAATLLVQLRGGWDDGKRKANELVAGTFPIVLDDLDKAHASEFGREVMFATIDNRVQAGAALVVTTNLPLSMLGEKLGDAVMSRLAGYCDVYAMDGEDRRISGDS